MTYTLVMIPYETLPVEMTNDFDELLRIVDRVVVFNDGRIVGDLKNENLSPDMVIDVRDRRAV